VALLNAKSMGLVFGILLGLLIFIATNWLLVKGPQPNSAGQYVVGPHLGLLSQFFIGYSVSFLGSIVGFIYGFALGTIAGTFVGWLYNRIVMFRQR
ncbi:MAG: hypothetical protein KJ002_02905, partial [Candidatus Dadabacteria bacterium]|nr:hypothetical protein [Candidatus Dadabacteria bacterium]